MEPLARQNGPRAGHYLAARWIRGHPRRFLGERSEKSEGTWVNRVQVGASATGYLAGAVAGALFFGWLTDRLGRKKLFLITLALYLSATAATAFSWNFWSFLLFRILTGAGIGGEYAAINSAIDELVPAAVRGNVDLVINATFWIGAALGTGGTLFLLNSSLFSPTFS